MSQENEVGEPNEEADSKTAKSDDGTPRQRLERRYHTFAKRMHQTNAEDLLEQFIQGSLATPFGARLIEIDHDVSVNIAVAGVAETGDRKAVFPLQPGGQHHPVLRKPAVRTGATVAS